MPLLTRPDSWPSVTTATWPVRPAPSRAKTSWDAMPMPGDPVGPWPRSTTTWPALTRPARTAVSAWAGEPNTTAGPAKSSLRSSATASLTIPPSGARLPRISTIVGRCPRARSGGRMTSESVTVTPARFSPTVRPVTVSASPCSSGSSCFITARVPPASSNASIGTSPLARTAASNGTRSASSSNIRYTSAPHSASAATACRCFTELIEPLTSIPGRRCRACDRRASCLVQVRSCWPGGMSPLTLVATSMSLPELTSSS